MQLLIFSIIPFYLCALRDVSVFAHSNIFTIYVQSSKHWEADGGHANENARLRHIFSFYAGFLSSGYPFFSCIHAFACILLLQFTPQPNWHICIAQWMCNVHSTGWKKTCVWRDECRARVNFTMISSLSQCSNLFSPILKRMENVNNVGQLDVRETKLNGAEGVLKCVNINCPRDTKTPRDYYAWWVKRCNWYIHGFYSIHFFDVFSLELGQHETSGARCILLQIHLPYVCQAHVNARRA